jgi:ERCC4-type nuclease
LIAQKVAKEHQESVLAEVEDSKNASKTRKDSFEEA